MKLLRSHFLAGQSASFNIMLIAGRHAEIREFAGLLGAQRFMDTFIVRVP